MGGSRSSGRVHPLCSASLVFLKHAATTEIYTLSLHDALPILLYADHGMNASTFGATVAASTLADLYSTVEAATVAPKDRKSTRLNSSHGYISYAVFCLKKKNTDNILRTSGYLSHCLRIQLVAS